MTDVVKLLDILESQSIALAGIASAVAETAAMIREQLSGGAQGAEAEEVLDKVLLMPRTFGDGRGARRKPTGEE